MRHSGLRQKTTVLICLLSAIVVSGYGALAEELSVLTVEDPTTRRALDATGHEQLWIDFDLVNRSSRSIMAWSLMILHGSSDGDGELTLERSVDCFLDPEPATAAAEPHVRGPLLPGQSHRTEIPVPRADSAEVGRFPVVSVEVRAIVFEDLKAVGDQDDIREVFETRAEKRELFADLLAALRAIELDATHSSEIRSRLEALSESPSSELAEARRLRYRTGQLSAEAAKRPPKDEFEFVPWLLKQYLEEIESGNRSGESALRHLVNRVEGYYRASYQQAGESDAI